MKKLFPSGVIRGYLLDVEFNSSEDEEYYLCFGTTGDMYVLIFYSPNNGYSKGYWSDPIKVTEFNKLSINGEPLTQLVQQKLMNILPPGAETHH